MICGHGHILVFDVKVVEGGERKIFCCIIIISNLEITSFRL